MPPSNRVQHFQIGDARRENSPQACHNGTVLAEGFYADCACRGHWYLGVWKKADGSVWYGWNVGIAHSQDCKKAAT